MSERARGRAGGGAAIVARIGQREAAREMAAEFTSQMPAFAHLSDASRAEIFDGLARSIRRWSLFLATGTMPADEAFDPLREWARARATEGVRLEDLLRSFGLAHQVGWRLLRRHAREDDAEALLGLVGPLAEYVDHVSAVVTETYLAERELLVSEEERRTRSLLERLCVDSPLDSVESELAERLGVPIESAYTPFAIVMSTRRPHSHAALAARLRRSGWRLAVTQGDCIVGLSWEPLELIDLGEGPELVLAIGEPTARAGLTAALEEVTVLCDYARGAGLRGRLQARDHLLEILLARSAELALRLREKVLGPLGESEHSELLRTLQTLISCRLDRTAASAALHIHRNTLAYRLRRIEEITGLDLGSPHDLACLYIAIEHA